MTEPALRFSLKAHTQLQWFLQRTPNEVACWGVCEDPDDPLYVTRLYFPKQENSQAYVEMDDTSNLMMLSTMAKKDIHPYQCQRIWIHTHPGNSASPSGTDQKTLDRISEGCPWFVMFIMAKGGQYTCTLRCRYQHPVTGSDLVEDTKLKTVFDRFPRETMQPTDLDEWEAIYQEVCNERKPARNLAKVGPGKAVKKAKAAAPPLPGLGHLLKSDWNDDVITDDDVELLNSMSEPAPEKDVPPMPRQVELMSDVDMAEAWKLTPEARSLLFDICHWEYNRAED